MVSRAFNGGDFCASTGLIQASELQLRTVRERLKTGEAEGMRESTEQAFVGNAVQYEGAASIAASC